MISPWRIRGGRVSPLKLVVFVALFVPGLAVAYALAMGTLGAEPANISGAAFGRFLADETEKWTKIIQSSGATMN